MDWINNLMSYTKNKNPGRCPSCGSDNIEVEEMDIGRKSITFTCMDCKKTEHFDGLIEK